ncbi:MAG TPA: hypothetical protein VI389_03675 [Geobacteraceae bacterium]
MKGPLLNKLHRYAGIMAAPFMIIQTASGLLLSFGPFRRTLLSPSDSLAPPGPLDRFLTATHFGPGLINDAYHVLLGASFVWMALSGWLLYLRGRRARRAAFLQRQNPS